MKGATKPFAIAGLLLIAAFFGPWIDVLHVHRSGWDLAHATSLGWKRHVFWLYPAGGLALALSAWRGSPHTRSVALAVGGFVVGLAAYRLGDGLVSGLRYGAWLAIASALGAIAAAVSARREAAMLAGVGVIAAFFLPWFGSGRAAMSGFDLARLGAAPAGLDLPAPSWLFFVPLLGALATLAALFAPTRRVTVLAGAAVLVLLVYLYIRTLGVVVGWGVWLTLAAGAFALLAALLSRPASPAPAPAASRGGAPAASRRGALARARRGAPATVALRRR